ncbi:MAG: ComEC family competence protein [Candidatus Omnitrophica bacterium]|nr:ComEC family competence protein [Candidatus Omnitrophota bacterium]
MIPLFFIQKLNKKYLFLFIFFLSSGYFSMYIYQKDNKKINFSKLSSIEGEVISVKERPFEKEILIKTKKIFTEDNEYETTKKIIITTKERKKFLKGENVKIKVKSIKEINSPKNPFEFNYKKFMERQGIFFKVISDEIETLNNTNLNLWFSYLREKVEKRIEKYTGFNPEASELIKLLTLGSDDPPDFLKELGIKTGIYHLFVISGIHIVFLIFFLRVLFIPFQRLNNTKPKLFPSLILFILWFYNFLCGFRIPITRAVLMTSFYLISEILEKEIDFFTSIIFSCILLLLINPSFIYSISFLLSFLATGGILILYPKVNIFKKNNFFINLLVISLSAQLFILPIIFYNFGYFYPLGILNNLIFTPFVGLITITSFVSIFITFLFLPLNLIIDFFLKCLTYVSHFSPQIIIYSSLLSVFSYYIILSILILKLKKKIKIFLLSTIIFFLFVPQFLNKTDKKEIIFFSSKNPLILVRNQNKGVLIVKGGFKRYKNWREILLKITKKEKLYIEKIILVGKESLENLFWLSKFCKEIYTDAFEISINSPLNYSNIRKTPKKIEVYDVEINVIDGNLIIKSGKFKVLILFNEFFEKLLFSDKYLLTIYPAEFKRSRKNEKLLNELNPFFYIIPKDIKKFENLKSLCKNYYLDKSTIIVDLKTGIQEYWKDDKRKY